MNGTADAYRMNPAEDALIYGDKLEEGMWVLPSSERIPRGDDEDSRLRAQRFRRVTRLHREGGGPGMPDRVVFIGEWVDGYSQEHRYGVSHTWIVKKAPAPEVTATVSKGDIICIIPEKGPERVMTVAHVEHYVITLADLPEEGEGEL